MSSYTAWIRNIFNQSISTASLQRHCYQPNPPSNADFTGDVSPPYETGKIIQFVCNECYIGDGTAECISGRWHFTGSCRRVIPCPDPEFIQNARRDPMISSWTCGSSVSYTCINNYQPVGPTSSVCVENDEWGEWDPPINSISCRATDCGSPKAPSNAQFTEDISPPYNYGRKVQFSCRGCFTGQGTVECTSGGTWHTTGACYATRGCPNPGFIHNAWRDPIFSSWTCGSSVSYKCNNGYQPAGPTTSKCQLNQQWDPPINWILCRAIGCQSPNPPNNAYFNEDITPSYEIGRVIQFSCNECFAGHGTMQCTSSGIWFIGGTCRRVTCADPGPVDNALYIASRSWSCGSSVSYSCNYGFEPNEQTTSMCQSNRQWNPPISSISCISTGIGCLDPGSRLNANRSPYNQNIFNDGDTVVYTCNRCYRAAMSVLTCSAGTWTGQDITCFRMRCPSFPARSNLRSTFSGNSCGTIINFSCSQEFELIGPSQIECLPVDEDRAEWTSQPPTCQPIQTTTTTTTVQPSSTTIARARTTTLDFGNTAYLVVVGGRHKLYGMDQSLNTVDIYYLNSGSITGSQQGRSSPLEWTKAGRALYDENVYIFGGHIMSRRMTFFQYGFARYRLEDDSWERLPDVPFETYKGPALFIHQNVLYAVGGHSSSNNNQVWALDLTHGNGETQDWTQENIVLPHSVSGANTVLSIGDRVFIIGKAGEHSTSVISWRPGTINPWETESDMSVARHQGIHNFFNSLLYSCSTETLK